MPASLASNTVLYKQQGLNTEALRGRKKKMLGQRNHNSISDNTLEVKQKMTTQTKVQEESSYFYEKAAGKLVKNNNLWPNLFPCKRRTMRNSSKMSLKHSQKEAEVI